MNEDMNIEELTKSLTASVQTNVDLIKLEAVERTSVVGSSASVIFIVSFFIHLLFKSFCRLLFIGLPQGHVQWICPGSWFLLACMRDTHIISKAIN